MRVHSERLEEGRQISCWSSLILTAVCVLKVLIYHSNELLRTTHSAGKKRQAQKLSENVADKLCLFFSVDVSLTSPLLMDMDIGPSARTRSETYNNKKAQQKWDVCLVYIQYFLLHISLYRYRAAFAMFAVCRSRCGSLSRCKHTWTRKKGEKKRCCSCWLLHVAEIATSAAAAHGHLTEAWRVLCDGNDCCWQWKAANKLKSNTSSMRKQWAGAIISAKQIFMQTFALMRRIFVGYQWQTILGELCNNVACDGLSIIINCGI